MSQPRPSVVIIGAGFTGSILAAHLLRRHGEPLRIAMINRSGRLARGVAYGTRSSRHVLNVPAGRMSAFADDEDDFLRFARERLPDVTGGSFVPRRLYGEYLEHVLLAAEANATRGSVLEHVVDEARRVAVDASGGAVHLAGGRTIRGDRIVIALGNYAPAQPRIAHPDSLESRYYIRDPWLPGALDAVPADRPVLLIGTGLTMFDLALDLASRGRTAPLLALSRRGLLPQPHRPHGAPPSYAHMPPALVACPPTAVDYLRAIRQHVRHVARAGVDWRDVVASLRPVTPQLWARLDARERARFLRHLRSYWDVHRHRVAPELSNALNALLQRDELRVLAARLLDCKETATGMRVSVRRRGAAESEQLEVAAVVNCTGPSGDVRDLDDPLMRHMLADHLARPDAVGLGLEISDDYALVDALGRPSRVLSLVGPLLKGRFWEATAVPELRVHAARLAERLTRELATAPLRHSA